MTATAGESPQDAPGLPRGVSRSSLQNRPFLPDIPSAGGSTAPAARRKNVGGTVFCSNKRKYHRASRWH